MTPSYQRIRRAFACAFALMLVVPATSLAQRTGENAILEAEDAFGFSVGPETIGLYSSTSVRGFSPIKAGNVRVEGLYFHQLTGLSTRVRRSTNIRVGLASLGFPFPSPTGVVNYELRTPGDERFLSAFQSIDTDGTRALEIDAVFPLDGYSTSLGLALSALHTEFPNGSDREQYTGAFILKWQASDRARFVAFATRSDVDDDEIGPTYVPAGDYLPKTALRRQFTGPDWATYKSSAINAGLLGNAVLDDRWRLQAGAFYSGLDNHTNFTNLMLDVQPDGLARQLVVADPRTSLASASGEVRLTARGGDAASRHLLHFSGRARRSHLPYGGSDAFDLGETRVDRPSDVAKPSFRFVPHTESRVSQWALGVGYEAHWLEIGELNAGVQRSAYQKSVTEPGLPKAAAKSSELLYNAAVAVQIGPGLVAYASTARGLEENGVAPSTAANRNEVLPVLLTSQRDIGLRWEAAQGLRFLAGFFEIRKPSFTFDVDNIYKQLGLIRNRGVEFSVAVRGSPELRVIGGAVLLDARTTGDGVRLGRLGERPVGQTPITLNLNLDWRPPDVRDLSIDLSVTHTGRRMATANNRVELPARMRANVGARWRLNSFGKPITVRFLITNVTNDDGLELVGSNAYELSAPRAASVSLTADF